MASVPFSLECSKDSGFVMDPNEHKRVGYIIELDGFGLEKEMKQDLQVAVPFNVGDAALGFAGMKLEKSAAGPSTTKVVGVIEKFEWNGGVGDPLKIEFYTSQFNAHTVKALQQQALKTTMVKKLVWWVADFDQEVKCWFEQAYPKDGKVTGIVTGKENPELDVDLNPVVAKDGIDVNVYKITMGIVPAANKAYTLHFANSSKMNTIKAWGLKVGDLAAEALPG